MRRTCIRTGLWKSLWLCCLLGTSNAWSAEPAAAGLRIEIEPLLSKTSTLETYSNQIPSARSTQGTLVMDAWSSGGFGAMLRLSGARSSTPYEDTDYVTRTWSGEIGPTWNLLRGPRRFLLGLGPVMSREQVTEDTVKTLAEDYDLAPLWDQETSAGVVARARLDHEYGRLRDYFELRADFERSIQLTDTQGQELADYNGLTAEDYTLKHTRVGLTVGVGVQLHPNISAGLYGVAQRRADTTIAGSLTQTYDWLLLGGGLQLSFHAQGAAPAAPAAPAPPPAP